MFWTDLLFTPNFKFVQRFLNLKIYINKNELAESSASRVVFYIVPDQQTKR